MSLPKKIANNKLLHTLSIVICLSACAYQPERQSPAVELPSYTQIPTGSQMQPTEYWWHAYGSDELTQLFAELESNNFDLNAATLRIKHANALLGQQRAENWPSLDVQLSTRNTRDIDTDNSQHSSGLDFSAGYEIDLWGSRSAAQFSAQLSVVIKQQQYQSLKLQLQASLAQNYFALLAQRDRLTIAEQNLHASQELLNIIQMRFDAGSASGIELNQQRNTWLSTRAQVLDLERILVTHERVIAVLLGHEALTMRSIKGTLSTLILPAVKPIQPAALLKYRPDVQLAESQWRLSEAALYQTRKQRWPTLNLSAGIGLDDILNGGEGWLTSLGSSLSAPLFNAGRIRNQIAAADTNVSIDEVNYRYTVITAIQDALETLSEFSYQEKLLTVRKQTLTNNQRLYHLAKLRYDSGDTDFLNLLTAQRSWFSARDSLIQVKNNQLLATINIYRAMGVAPHISN